MRCHQCAPVEASFRWNMLYHTLRVDSPRLDIMRSATWQPPYSLRCATTCALSQDYSLCQTKPWQVLQLTVKWCSARHSSKWILGGTFERTFFDVRVFNPHAPSNRHTQLSSCYRKHEQVKKRAYEQRIREVEHASFTPLVISATGGLASEASTFYKRLASMLASKWDHP